MVGAPSIKGGTPRENLTTLHTTPHTQLSPFRSNSSTSVQGFGEPECSSSSCCHGGSAAAPAAVSHVHRLR
uniref:Uncharacterized protein n=1 Tax=Arundo donax TaxID=35708 RepID=A0A0A9DIZ8_ARUDO